MDVEFNYLAVLLAAVSSMLVGSIWYMPQVFGKSWTRLSKVKLDKNLSGKAMLKMYGGVFAASLFTAYVLAHVAFLSSQFFGSDLLQAALSTGFWLWLGFTATRIFVHDVFENRPFALTVLNSAHELATILVMAIVIGKMGS
mgnify:CR=1 FL=1